MVKRPLQTRLLPYAAMFLSFTTSIPTFAADEINALIPLENEMRPFVPSQTQLAAYQADCKLLGEVLDGKVSPGLVSLPGGNDGAQLLMLQEWLEPLINLEKYGISADTHILLATTPNELSVKEVSQTSYEPMSQEEFELLGNMRVGGKHLDFEEVGVYQALEEATQLLASATEDWNDFDPKGYLRHGDETEYHALPVHIVNELLAGYNMTPAGVVFWAGKVKRLFHVGHDQYSQIMAEIELSDGRLLLTELRLYRGKIRSLKPDLLGRQWQGDFWSYRRERRQAGEPGRSPSR